MKLKELTPLQKKKILYSLLAIGVCVAIGVTSWYLWDNIQYQDWATIKTRIAASIPTYLGYAFLIFKIIWFFVWEYKSKKDRVNQAKELLEIGERKIMKKNKSTNLKEQKWEFNDFTFEIKKGGDIVISPLREFNSEEEYYNKFRDNSKEFVEKMRKFLAGDE